MTRDKHPTIIVSPERGNRFYMALAADMVGALAEAQIDSRLVSAEELATVEESELRHASVLLVNPLECALSGDEVIERASSAVRTVAVVSECAETRWYRKQFNLGIEFDAFFDVGFLPQNRNGTPPQGGYRFVFNGVRPGETFTSPPRPRALRWVLVGHETRDRAQLGAALVEQVSPNGFLFMPPIRPPGRPGADLGAATLRKVLTRADTYVWTSHHSFAYYESFRFRDAILAGALPCKIDAAATGGNIPGVYASVADLAEVLRREDCERLFREAVMFYEAQGSLAKHLGDAFHALA